MDNGGQKSQDTSVTRYAFKAYAKRRTFHKTNQT